MWLEVFFARVIYCSFWFIWSLVKFSSRTLYHQSRVITCVGSKSSWAARTSSRWTRCSIFFRNPFFNYYSSSFCQNKFSPLPAWNSILGLFSNDFLFFSRPSSSPLTSLIIKVWLKLDKLVISFNLYSQGWTKESLIELSTPLPKRHLGRRGNDNFQLFFHGIISSIFQVWKIDLVHFCVSFFGENVESIGISRNTQKSFTLFTQFALKSQATALFLHFSGTFSHDFPPTRNTKVNGNSIVKFFPLWLLCGCILTRA